MKIRWKEAKARARAIRHAIKKKTENNLIETSRYNFACVSVWVGVCEDNKPLPYNESIIYLIRTWERTRPMSWSF